MWDFYAEKRLLRKDCVKHIPQRQEVDEHIRFKRNKCAARGGGGGSVHDDTTSKGSHGELRTTHQG